MGGRLSFFLPAWQWITLGPVCPRGNQTGVFPPFYEATPFVSDSYGDPLAQAAVQTTTTVGRGFVPPTQGGHGDCRSVAGPGAGWRGVFTPTIPWLPSALVGCTLLSIFGDSTRLFELPSSAWRLSPQLYSIGSSQGLVDGVAGSQVRLSACADTPQSLAIPLVYSQELGRGAHYLSMESPPFWLSHPPGSGLWSSDGRGCVVE